MLLFREVNMAASKESIQQSILLIVLTALVVLFKPYVWYGFHYVALLHERLSHGLATLFSGNYWGLVLQQTLAISLVPIGLMVLAGVIYYLVKKKSMPGLSYLLWSVWMVLLTLWMAPRA